MMRSGKKNQLTNKIQEKNTSKQDKSINSRDSDQVNEIIRKRERINKLNYKITQ
jgi:hypothetical protein